MKWKRPFEILYTISFNLLNPRVIFLLFHHLDFEIIIIVNKYP